MFMCVQLHVCGTHAREHMERREDNLTFHFAELESFVYC